jgi:hypothetical protein
LYCGKYSNVDKNKGFNTEIFLVDHEGRHIPKNLPHTKVHVLVYQPCLLTLSVGEGRFKDLYKMQMRGGESANVINVPSTGFE